MSCDLSDDLSGSGDSGERQFWARNFDTGVFYRVNAERLASNSRCEVWVEKNSGVTAVQAEEVATVYYDLYSNMMNTFGWTMSFSGIGQLNTMQTADMLGDNNGKLIILLLDIQDGYTESGNEGYVGGYFWSGDLLDIDRSNKSDMIYIDVNPGFKNMKDAYSNLAHEMQHLMNFVTNHVLTSNGRRESDIDLWINEGLSTAAEWVYGGHSLNRIIWYNLDLEGTIAKGNNFFVWDQNEDNSVLDDYATVYLFFQWLRLQKGIDIYNKIMLSDFYDHNAVVNAFGATTDWGSLLGTWLAANYIGNKSGEFGYKNEIKLNKHYIDVSGTSVDLYPGEGVYSYVSSGTYSVPANTGNINFLGLGTSNTVSSIPAGGALLTYNVSTTKIRNPDGSDSASQDSGTITGDPPPSPNIQAAVHASRSVSNSAFSGLNPIGAGDVLRRRGNYERFDAISLMRSAENNEQRSTGGGVQHPLIIEGEIMRYRDFPNE